MCVMCVWNRKVDTQHKHPPSQRRQTLLGHCADTAGVELLKLMVGARALKAGEERICAYASASGQAFNTAGEGGSAPSCKQWEGGGPEAEKAARLQCACQGM